MIQFRVVEAVQQVNRAWARRGHAHANLAGELGMGAGHERSQLFMTGLDERHAIARAIERAQQSVDAVSGVSINSCHAPLGQSLEDVIRHRLSHRRILRNRRVRAPVVPP
jgi:hypothetical protein